jgi:RpiB/LacA/LacB family sugar-phosphate isomerase
MTLAIDKSLADAPGKTCCGNSVSPWSESSMRRRHNKVKGIRAGLCYDHYSVRQGVEDDDMNVLCLGGRVMGIEVAWDHAQTFILAVFSGAERHHRRLSKVARLEGSGTS